MFFSELQRVVAVAKKLRTFKKATSAGFDCLCVIKRVILTFIIYQKNESKRFSSDY